jgi:hypothetical protein
MVVYIQYRVVVRLCVCTYTNNHTIVANIHTLLNISVQRLDGLIDDEGIGVEQRAFMMQGRNNNNDDDDDDRR